MFKVNKCEVKGIKCNIPSLNVTKKQLDLILYLANVSKKNLMNAFKNKGVDLK